MQKQNIKTGKRSKRLVIIISIIIVVILMIDIFMIGNVGYVVKWVECGRQPVVVHSTASYFHSQQREVTIIESPGALDIKGVPIPFIDSTLYCSLDEAGATVSTGTIVHYK